MRVLSLKEDVRAGSVGQLRLVSLCRPVAGHRQRMTSADHLVGDDREHRTAMTLWAGAEPGWGLLGLWG
ncbi:MAG: hypothetical protein ACI8RZ_004056 [Myxococcota bacterium]|jgi:hypothetical protein